MPLVAAAPRLIATIPYGDITSAGAQQDFLGVLARNVRARTFHFVSTLNQTVTSLSVYIWDSTLKTDSPQDLTGNGTSLGTVNDSGITVADSGPTPMLATKADTLSVTLAATTVPTSGNLEVYVTEEF